MTAFDRWLLVLVVLVLAWKGLTWLVTRMAERDALAQDDKRRRLHAAMALTEILAQAGAAMTTKQRVFCVGAVSFCAGVIVGLVLAAAMLTGGLP